MREIDPSLETLALLYANGELDGTDCADFEQRLAADQEAREALVQAVELAQSLTGSMHAPNPDYRAGVQSRLLPRGLWTWLGRRRSYRGHPVAWLLAGAAVAAVLLLALPSTVPSGPSSEVPPVAPLAVTPPAPTESEAAIWVDLTNADHLVNAVAEVKGRRDRVVSKKPGNLDLRTSKGLKEG